MQWRRLPSIIPHSIPGVGRGDIRATGRGGQSSGPGSLGESPFRGDAPPRTRAATGALLCAPFLLLPSSLLGWGTLVALQPSRPFGVREHWSKRVHGRNQGPWGEHRGAGGHIGYDVSPIGRVVVGHHQCLQTFNRGAGGTRFIFPTDIANPASTLTFPNLHQHLEGVGQLSQHLSTSPGTILARIGKPITCQICL
jgi:hypothetical protein